MVDCEFCSREMTEAESCSKNAIVEPNPSSGRLDGITVAAVPYGGETRYDDLTPEGDAPDGRCHDCGVLPGGYHHPGCDWEEDPITGEQLLGRVLDEDTTRMHARIEADPHEGITWQDIIAAQQERLDE